MRKLFTLFLVTLTLVGVVRAGDGTEENPYTIAEAIALSTGSDLFWAQGYIVAGRYGELPATNDYGISIADDASETDVNNCLQLKLESDGGRSGWGMSTNPDVAGKIIKFKGYRDTYGNYPSFEGVAFETISEVSEELVISYETQVSSANNDAEEGSDGGMYFDSSDLELVEDGSDVQTVGIRFTDIMIPQGSTIKSAYLQFTVDETSSATTNVVIKADSSDNSAAFEDVSFNISSRLMTENSVSWDIAAWATEGEAGDDQKSPDVASVVQSIISLQDWEAGNALSFVLTGSGSRIAESYDGDASAAPQLIVEFTSDDLAPYVAEDIEDQNIIEGWNFSYYIGKNFADFNDELSFTAELVSGEALPAWLSLSTAGTFSGTSTEVQMLAIKVTATGGGEEVSDIFNLGVRPNSNPFLTQVSTIQLGTEFDSGAAEISAFDPTTDQLFVCNAEANAVDVVSISADGSLAKVGSIDISAYGNVNSVAVKNGKLAAAIENDNKQNAGIVAVYNTADYSTVAFTATVGALPDMVTFNEDGTKIVVANEGEPSSDYTNDPEGSISIVDVATEVVTTLGFDAYDKETLISQGIRIFGPDATVSKDMEPEYITVKGDSAYVTCQENNAVVVVDLVNMEIDNIYPLGYKDHSLAGNGIDASNKADYIDIQSWPIYGIYMPDAIASYRVAGTTYVVTANEGDAREYIYEVGEEEVEAYIEEADFGDLKLDATVFPNADELQSKYNLGKLTVTTALADTNAEGEYQTVYSFGARSFSIWNAETGAQVYDSGDDFEQITAAMFPENFNCADDDYSAKDRSDNKGPEPEAVALGVVDGKTYAFIGLERMGGIMVYDITDPAAPEFVEYTNNRDFSVNPEDDFLVAGDNGPEGLLFIDAEDSPSNQSLIVVSNEVSGTVTVYSAGEAVAPYTLAVFHNNDGESDLLEEDITLADGTTTTGGSVAQFKTVLDTERARVDALGYASIMLSSGDNFLAGKEFNASKQNGVFYDAMALDALDYDAICLGNHDFDFGPGTLTDFINAYETNKAPYLSSNINFGPEERLDSLVSQKRIVPYTIVEKNGEQIGVIGLTTDKLKSISSPGLVEVSAALADTVNAYVDTLEAKGINKIILISHLQDIDEELSLIQQVSGVDIVIAGGGDELLANSEDLAVFGEEIYGSYPLVQSDAADQDVYVVTTQGNYRYLGNLVVDFDADGVITKVYDSNPILVAGVSGDATLESTVVDPVEANIAALTTHVIATSDVALDYIKTNVRMVETNGGNLVADAMLWQAQQNYVAQGLTTMPNVAIVNGGGLRAAVTYDAGDFTEVYTFDVCAFDNNIAVMQALSAEAFKAVMENAVSNAENADGRFAQVAGFSFTYNILAEAGSRVLEITLDDGTKIVENGELVSGAPTVEFVTNDFTFGGGDDYPFAAYGYTDYVKIGATYQEAFYNYIVDGLSGSITATDYPEGGEGRITQVKEPMLVDLTFTDGFASIDAWTAYSVVGDQVWTVDATTFADTTTAYMNGYENGYNDNEDWLISPAFNVADMEYIVMKYSSYSKYSGGTFAVKYSNDYVGYDSPAEATWSDVPEATLAEGGSRVWTSSYGVIENSHDTVYVAFVYTSSTTSCGNLYLDSVAVFAPAIAVTSHSEGETVTTENIEVTYSLANFTLGVDGKLVYALDGGSEEVLTSLANISLSSLTNGTHSLLLKLVDMEDNELISKTFTFTIDVDNAATDFAAANFNVYPNPAKTQVSIEAASEISEVVIYNVAGKVLASYVGAGTQMQLNVSELNKGIYILSVQSSATTHVTRLVIE